VGGRNFEKGEPLDEHVGEAKAEEPRVCLVIGLLKGVGSGEYLTREKMNRSNKLQPVGRGELLG